MLDRARLLHVGYQTHYLIISKTNQRKAYASAMGNVIIFKTNIFVARRAGFRAGFRPSHVAMVFTLVCGQSRDFRVYRRVSRRVHNRIVSIALVLIDCHAASHTVDKH